MKKKHVLAVLVCVLIVLGAGTAVLFKLMDKPEPVADETGVKLYWNIDRQTYVGDSTAGMDSRERAADGYYKVRFALDGEQVEYNVKKARLLHKIDSMDIMGLAIDEDNTIVAVYDPEDITGGEVAALEYVVFAGDSAITVSPNETLDDDYRVLTVTEKTGIYNVTGLDPVGHKDSAVTSDCIRAFKDEEGDLTYVFIVERYGYWAGEVAQGYCEHCDQIVDWYVWKKSYDVPTASGHWKLSCDIKASSQYDIITGRSIIIDLNGKTVTAAADKRIYTIKGTDSYLAILDTSEDGSGIMIGNGAPLNGGIIQVRYGSFDLYGGTLDASNVATLQYGSAVRVNVDTVFNMYNGTIIGGQSVGAMDDDEKKTTGGYGGTIQVGGTFNMYNGVVRDGTATRYEKKDGSYVSGNGGNIHLGTGAVMNMYGGEILNGTAERQGGNIYLGTNAVFNMSGGTVSGGVVSESGGYGGNIYSHKSGSVINLSGGTIKDGTALGTAGNIALYGTLNMSGGTVSGGRSMSGKTLATAVYKKEYPHHNIYVVGGTLNMSGGYVKGYLRIRDTGSSKCTVSISGTARILGDYLNLSLDPGDEVDFGTLQKGADIRINGGGYVSTATSKSNVAYVRSTYDGVETQYINNKLFIGKQACVCGGTTTHIGDCKGELLDWIPWGQDEKVPSVAANWYLVTDVTMTDQMKIEADATFRLDLNGHTITGADATRVYALRNGGITMVITDHSADKSGAIVARGEAQGRGLCVWVSDNGSLTMYGGTLDASAASCPYNGPTLTVDEGCTFVMYGGTLKGGKSVCLISASGKSTNGFGGTLAVSGVAKIYDGEITGGYSEKNGGNIFVGKTGKFEMYGGSVRKGTAKSRGGNIAGSGLITIYGGTVSEGTAGAGGNMYVSADKGQVLGGTISDGTATHGGNILVAEGISWKAADAVITGGTVTSSNGGNIETEKDTSVQLNGVTVTNGEAPKNGGNIMIRGLMEVTGGLISEGSSDLGGNVYLDTTATFELNDGIIEKGVAGTHGGSIYTTGILNINGGEIRDSQCKTQGGNIFVGKAATMTLSGGSITNGTAYRGGNIAGTGIINLLQGTISGGSADLGGNVSINTNGKMAGVTIADGQANTYGGNVYVEGKLTIEDGTITGGTAPNGGSICVIAGGSLTVNEGTISGGNASKTGGNVYVAADTSKGKNGGSITVNGGTITEGSALQGGNIYLQADVKFAKAGAALHMAGGNITNGKATAAGGNVAALGVFTMTDGTISGGTVDTTGDHKYGGNVYTVPGTNGCAFTMTGGTIAGLVRVNSTGQIVLGGTAKITNTDGYENVTLNKATILIDSLAEGALIGINPSTIAGYFAEGATAEDAKYFASDDGITTVEYEDGKLMLISWTDWTSASDSGKLPTKTGYYRLAENMTVSAASTLAKNATVYVDLAGYTVTGANNTRIYVLDTGSILNITDSSTEETGKIVGNRTATNEAGMIYVKGQGAVLSLYKGTIDASGISQSGDSGNGGAVYTNATFNMYGGKIIGGTSKYGGSIYVNKGGSLNLSGGVVTGGKSLTTGGNIYVAADQSAGKNPGTMTMSGGVVTLGYATTQGGNIYLQQGTDNYPYGAILTMTDGTISKGTAVTAGGNIMALGVINMSGGTITGGICDVTGAHKYGANIYTIPGAKGCAFTMTGGKITGWIRVNNAGAFTLGGTAVITDGSDNVITEEGKTYGNSGICGLDISKSNATLVEDEKTPLTEGAAIYLSVNSSDSSTNLIVKSKVSESGQAHLALCGDGKLVFTSEEIDKGE